MASRHAPSNAGAARFVRCDVANTEQVAEAYGQARPKQVVQLAAALQSAGLYGCAKWLEERLGMRYAALHGFRFTALRYCAVFGPSEAASAGMAQGHEKAQLTYVFDAVDARLALMSASELRHAEYNIAGPPENYMSLRDYHAQIASLFPRTAGISFTGRAKSGGISSIRRLVQDSGFTPSVRVAEGLRRMYGAESQPT